MIRLGHVMSKIPDDCTQSEDKAHLGKAVFNHYIPYSHEFIFNSKQTEDITVFRHGQSWQCTYLRYTFLQSGGCYVPLNIAGQFTGRLRDNFFLQLNTYASFMALA